MPPCQAVLLNKIRRTNFVVHLWKRAHLANPCILIPDEHGWTLEGSVYNMNWYNGEQLPQSVADILFLTDDSVEEDDEDDIDYSSSDESDDE